MSLSRCGEFVSVWTSLCFEKLFYRSSDSRFERCGVLSSVMITSGGNVLCGSVSDFKCVSEGWVRSLIVKKSG